MTMEWIERKNLVAVLPVAVLGAALFASSAVAQGRGMRSPGPVPRTGVPFWLGQRTGLTHLGQRRYSNSSAYLPSQYFYLNDDYDTENDNHNENESTVPDESPVQIIVAPPAQPLVPAPAPVEPLLLEYHDGQWVGVPTGSQMPARPQSMQSDSAKASRLRPGIASRKERAQPLPALPPTVLVFRDGHKEEVERYMIHGDVIYASMDYWSAGSWTREIPIAGLDIPATLKLNQERGGKFNLPSGPSEIVIHF
jgi:hypothetical protein